MKTSRAVACALAIGLCACGSDSSTTPPQPTLSSIQTEVFNNSCTFSACHNDDSAQGNLRLTSGNSFSQLVNVSAFNSAAAAAGKLRVVPGDPDNSFLIQKLEGPSADEGTRMPQTSGFLPQATIDVIRHWITNGAQDN
ncbi:MAG TPA: c-type cytochrome domain-containing protein [Bdellovibrionota bacterium]|nr:c-type cytochrome domain-containing protein [Bdellovibrionota bacterium]